MSLKPITPKRVVVTGLGFVTPIGNSLDQFWNSLSNGISGIKRIEKLDPTEFATQIAGEVRDFDPLDYLDRKEVRHHDPYCQYAMAACEQAAAQSNLEFDKLDKDRCGVIFGSGIGGMDTFEKQHSKLLKRGPKRVSPFFIPMLIADIAAGHISIKYDFRGSNWAPTSACATSAHATGLAMRSIRYGESDVVITGGAEAPITQMGLSGFCSLKAMSTRNDDPEAASRPFDADRDGFIMSEGSAVLILESEEHALERGAKILAEIAGAGFTGDAHHITAPLDDGRGMANAMRFAIADACLETDDIEYVNAHGTSTQLNDKAETIAIKSVFGDHARKLDISSTKSMHGHMLGATGAVEAGATILGINNQLIPPTINYQTPDPDCDLNITPNKAVGKKITIAISNSFGFGGHNASLVIRDYTN